MVVSAQEAAKLQHLVNPHNNNQVHHLDLYQTKNEQTMMVCTMKVTTLLMRREYL